MAPVYPGTGGVDRRAASNGLGSGMWAYRTASAWDGDESWVREGEDDD